MVEPTLSTLNSQAIKELQPKTTTLSVSPIATQPLNNFMKPNRLSLLMPFLTPPAGPFLIDPQGRRVGNSFRWPFH